MFGPVIFVLATFIGAIFGVIVFHMLGLGIGEQLEKNIHQGLWPAKLLFLYRYHPY